MKLKVKMFYSF